VALAQAGQIELTQVDCDAQGFVDPDAVREAIQPHTVLIAMTHASNVLGAIQDAAAVGRIAREHDLLFLLDAAQTAGVVPISIKQMNVDLLAFPGHKSLLGPTGTGGLYVGPRCPALPDGSSNSGQRSFRPWREGGTGGDSSTPTQPALFPYYLEGGTPNTVGVAGLSAAVDYVLAHTPSAMLAHEQALVQAIIDRLSDHPRVTIYGPRDAKRCVGTLSLNLQGYEAPDVGSILDDTFNIAVRPGLHCAPYAHKKLGTFPWGAVRISPGPFNTQDELNALLDALEQMLA
ncbi:MAG: aminotransferase class V-fold PLP-dependent enzyme, partial [Phycisphaeraceae bacterium]|nr:aminotransferase class V-fold PLP-dependent enzyme [Phycisphaeraceae bacterium]